MFKLFKMFLFLFVFLFGVVFTASAHRNPGAVLVMNLCRVLVSCNSGLTRTQCKEGLLNEPGLGAGFHESYGDLGYDSDRTMSDLVIGFAFNKHSVTNTAVISCRTYLKGLTCDDPGTIITNNDFSNVENIVEPPCEGIIRDKSTGYSSYGPSSSQ